MRLFIDAETYVGLNSEGRPSYNPLPDVSVRLEINGKVVDAWLSLEPLSGSYSGNVHSGISGKSVYEVIAIHA